MTSTEPMTYKPGPELDAIVAEKVLGRLLTWNRQFQYLTDEEKETDIRSFKNIPEYSTTWEGMRLVVEEMEKKRMHVALNNCAGDFLWSATVRDDRGYLLATHYEHELPHAVAVACLSALQHVSNTEE